MSGVTLSAEQVAALAPDASAAKAGQGLANARKWVSLGGSERALWGEASGSGAKPYQVIVDLQGMGFRCSCPSRKLPCKHVLGRLFLHSARAEAPSAPPVWVEEWIAGRDQRAARKVERAVAGPVDEKAARKRVEQREERVRAGMQEVARWVEDIVRQGIATLGEKPPSFWEHMASRMVDAQAPGMARLVRRVGEVPRGEEAWAGEVLARLGRIHLLAGAFLRQGALGEEVREDLRQALGFVFRQEQLAGVPPVADLWAVVGQRVEGEDRLRVQRTWLLGERTGREALVLSYAHGSSGFDTSFVLGSGVEAEMVYHPGSLELRASLLCALGEPRPLTTLGGVGGVEAGLEAYAQRLALFPWLEQAPLFLPEAGVVQRGGKWWVRDQDGAALSLAPSAESAAWVLRAAGGGRAMPIFGEWDGEHFCPLSCFSGERFLPLSSPS